MVSKRVYLPGQRLNIGHVARVRYQTSCLGTQLPHGLFNGFGVAACDNNLTVEDATRFNIGDTVLIIQMKGAVIDSTNTAFF